MVTREVALLRMKLHGERLYRNSKEGRSYIGLSIFPEDTLEPGVLQTLEAERVISWSTAIGDITEYSLITSKQTERS